MPVDFLSDEHVVAYGRFVGSVSELDLERFFFLDDDDLTIVGRRRGSANRLGFAVQLGTAVPGELSGVISRNGINNTLRVSAQWS